MRRELREKYLGPKKKRITVERNEWLKALPFRAEVRKVAAAMLTAGEYDRAGFQTKTITQSYLAQHAGVSQRTVARAYAKLETEGYLTRWCEDRKYAAYGGPPSPRYLLSLPSAESTEVPYSAEWESLASLTFDFPEFWSKNRSRGPDWAYDDWEYDPDQHEQAEQAELDNTPIALHISLDEEPCGCSPTPGACGCGANEVTFC